MSLRSKPFAAWVIAWNSNEFLRARLKLTGLYVLILAVGLATISVVLLVGVSYRLRQAVNIENVRVSLEQAERNAIDLANNAQITHAILENEQGQLEYKVQFADGREVIVDPFTGAAFTEQETYESFADIFYEDFEEMVWILDVALILLSLVLAYFLAGKTLKPIARKMDQQKQFIANAAHELRNPLAALRSSAESALHAPQMHLDQYRDIFKDILEESDYLIETTEQFLTLARYDEGAIEKKEVLLHAIVASVLRSVEPFAQQYDVSIRHNLQPFTLRGDATGLRSLVFNLVHNGIKFSKPGNTVEVSLLSTGKLVVRDFGLGIEATNIPKLFDRFFSEDLSHSTGSGLGLSVVQSVAYAHGARVGVESKQGKGTVFTVFF